MAARGLAHVVHLATSAGEDLADDSFEWNVEGIGSEGMWGPQGTGEVGGQEEWLRQGPPSAVAHLMDTRKTDGSEGAHAERSSSQGGGKGRYGRGGGFGGDGLRVQGGRLVDRDGFVLAGSEQQAKERQRAAQSRARRKQREDSDARLASNGRSRVAHGGAKGKSTSAQGSTQGESSGRREQSASAAAPAT